MNEDIPIVLERDERNCIGIERNGSRCIRIKRVGDYCWFHNPEDPKICLHIMKKGKRKGEKCGDPLALKQGIVITAKTKYPEGLFEKYCKNHMTHLEGGKYSWSNRRKDPAFMPYYQEDEV